jgi:ribonuclease HI
MQQVTEAVKKRLLVAVLTVDIESAFDTVNHERLVQKAVVLGGFTTQAAALLTSYLQGRSQSVRMRAGVSPTVGSSVGVPQGSVLGPHLFVLYTADFPHALSCADLVAYVDDFTLLVTAESVQQLNDKLCCTVKEVESYFASNAFVLADKSELMLIGTDEPTQVVIGGSTVKSADTITVLKVILDKKFTFVQQAKNTAAKVTATARGIASSFQSLRPNERATLMRAFAHPRLDFVWPVLVGASKPASDIVQRAYTRTARFSFTTRRIHHRPGGPSAEALAKLGWPSWEDRLTAMRRAFVLGVWVTGRPVSLRVLLPSDDSTGLGASLRHHHRMLLPVPGSKKDDKVLGRRGFSMWGAVDVNEVFSKPPPCEDQDRWAATGPMSRFPFRTDSTELLEFYARLRYIFRDSSESQHDNRVVVWTDGSAFEKESGGTKGRRAGGGVFYGAGSPKNSAVPVTGSRSAQRAELTAFLHVLREEERSFEVRTDAKYLVDGVRSLPLRLQRAWYRSPSMAQFVPNADLWYEVDWRLSRRPPGSCLLTKIKGHATEGDVRDGVISQLDAWGNAGADWVAQWAARHCGSDAVPARFAWLHEGT